MKAAKALLNFSMFHVPIIYSDPSPISNHADWCGIIDVGLFTSSHHDQGRIKELQLEGAQHYVAGGLTQHEAMPSGTIGGWKL